MILAGDIGGTSTRLGIFETDGTGFQLMVEQTYSSRFYGSLEDIVLKFTTQHPGVKIHHACFGVAGPVLEGIVRTPNLPWLIESRSLAAELALEEVLLINDLEANAHGVAVMASNAFITLNAGDSTSSGNAAIISAGTGLGEAGLYWSGQKHHPFACEGGHADFAPGNEQEVELLKYLRGEFGHVSWERVLSGPGLHNIYKFLRDTNRGEVSAQVADEICMTDPAKAISQAATEGRCGLCAVALDMFVAIYGAAAGNLALKMMARGGVYVGGGIAPKIILKLTGPTFMRAFVDKGRMRSLLERIPVRVIMNDRAALWGAACYSRRISPDGN